MPCSPHLRRLAAVCLLAVCFQARAADPVVLDIPAQPLAAALAQFSAQSGVKALYPAELLAGKTAPRVSGGMTPEAALAQLLRDSGLVFRFVGDGAVRIEAAPRGGAPVALPEVKVTASPLDETSYNVPNATTATKTDTPILETPVSVQVVPAAVIEDQAVNRLQEALENVSGVRSHNNDLEGYVYKVRGFSVLNLFRNGLAVPFTIPTIQETANLDRVEVLKGPASILFGRVDPGGVINLVTKRPLDQPYYKIEQEAGSHDTYRTQWDASGALNQNGSLAYRFSGAFQDYGSFRDFQDGQRTFLAPVFGYKFGPDTDLVLDLQYLKNEAQSDTGFPALGDRPAPIPLSRSFQEPNDPRDETESYSVGYTLKHALNPTWSVTNRFLYSHALLDKVNVAPVALLDDGRTLERNINHQFLDGDVYSINLDLSGDFEAAGARHQVLLGFDYINDYYDYRSFSLGGTEVVGADAGGHSGNLIVPGFGIDIFNPLYGNIPDSAYRDILTNPLGGKFFSSVQVKQTGLYFQDHITWFEKLHLLLGGRYDRARVDDGLSEVSAGEASVLSNRNEDKEFTPRVGLLYQPQPWYSVYTSYSQSFGANQGRSATGGRFDPQHGEQYETGVKAELLEGRLNATLAIFHLTRENILTPDLSTPDPEDSIAVGESRSQGVEIDLLGRITPRISLTAAYAYIDGEVTKDNNGFEGNRFENVARHAGKLFAIYDFGAGGWGWRVGGGVYASSDSAGNRRNTFTIPGYTRLDAYSSYTWRSGAKRWTAQFNLRNLLDKEYFDGTDIFYNSGGRLGLFPAQPFTVTASLRLEF